MKKIKAILMSAIICGLCCSCNSNTTTATTPTSETEETTPYAPETTAETTAVTTNAKTETTTAITTTTTTATEKTYSTDPVNVPIDEFDSLKFNFTEDDIMLQNTISEIIDGAWEYVDLSVACGFGGEPNIESIDIDLGFGRAMEYYFLYDGTIEDIRTGMSRYYSQKVVEEFLSNYHKCELGEKTEIGYKPLNIDQYFTRLEIGGKIYSIDGGIGGSWISKEVESGKVISKTDNEIIYCYLSYGSDSDLYCIQDRLVYEDGWKYDSFYRYIPKEIISVEEYYPEIFGQLGDNTAENQIQSEYIDSAQESEIFLFDCPNKRNTPSKEEQLETLENIFYGEWKADGKYENINLTYQDCYFDFAGACSPGSFIEIDEGYVLHYINGGVLQCFFIKKNNLSVMYDEYYDFGINGITIDEDTRKYHKSTELCSKDIMPGLLSSLGQIKLYSIIGGNFKECLNDNLNDGFDFIDSNGTEWIYSLGDMGIPVEERYLIFYSDNKVELAIRHFKKSEYDAYIDGDYSAKPEEKHFILTFEKINGEWEYSNTREY